MTSLISCLDWNHIYHRIRRGRRPQLLITDFPMVQALTRFYFPRAWPDITRRGGGWQCLQCGDICEYTIRIGTVDLFFQILKPIPTRAGVPTRQRVSLVCRDSTTGAPIGPRFYGGVSVGDLWHTLGWIDLHNGNNTL